MRNLPVAEKLRLYCIAFGPLFLAGFIGTLFGGLTGACIGAGIVIAVMVLKPYNKGRH